jgi:hypothetical protein
MSSLLGTYGSYSYAESNFGLFQEKKTFMANYMYDLPFDAKQVNKDLENNIRLQLSLNFQTVQLQVPIEIQGRISTSAQNEGNLVHIEWKIV